VGHVVHVTRSCDKNVPSPSSRRLSRNRDASVFRASRLSCYHDSRVDSETLLAYPRRGIWPARSSARVRRTPAQTSIVDALAGNPRVSHRPRATARSNARASPFPVPLFLEARSTRAPYLASSSRARVLCPLSAPARSGARRRARLLRERGVHLRNPSSNALHSVDRR
jgi:hypothetical protein